MATVIRILLMHLESFFESPEKDLKRMLEEAQKSPPVSYLYFNRGLGKHKSTAQSLKIQG